MVIKLDYDGIGKVLREQMAGPVREAAERIAETARGSDHIHGGKVSTKDFITDRAITVVMFSQPNAAAIEAKHGLLTKAANANGFEVKSTDDGLVDYVSKAGKKSRITKAQANNYASRR